MCRKKKISFKKLIKKVLVGVFDKNGSIINKRGRKPQISDLQILTWTMTQTYLEIQSEARFFYTYIAKTAIFKKHKCTLSNYNQRVLNLQKIKEILLNKIHLEVASLSEKNGKISKTFIIDTTPIETCKMVRARRRKIFKGFDKKPTIGYCAAKNQFYFGYKLTLIIDTNSLPCNFMIDSADMHDITILKKNKNQLLSGLEKSVVIADKGYIDRDFQAELKKEKNIQLITPYRKNSKMQNTLQEKKVLRKRKYIETVFSQMTRLFNIQHPLATSYRGIMNRILSIVTYFALKTYKNFLEGVPPSRQRCW